MPASNRLLLRQCTRVHSGISADQQEQVPSETTLLEPVKTGLRLSYIRSAERSLYFYSVTNESVYLM